MNFTIKDEKMAGKLKLAVNNANQCVGKLNKRAIPIGAVKMIIEKIISIFNNELLFFLSSTIRSVIKGVTKAMIIRMNIADTSF